MSASEDPLYEFVFRGLLTEEALDRAGRMSRVGSDALHTAVADALSLELLPEDLVIQARSMATVYTAIAAFENSVRKLIANVLLEEKGEDWWATSVSEKIRKRAESKRDEEDKVRWHTQRGADPIYYTLMGDLTSIIRQNWTEFEPFFPTIEWVASILSVVERSRNVIMHSGHLDRADVDRLGIFLRDWIRQVGV